MVPKLRFSEFNMPWKQTTLGSVSSHAAYGMNSSAIEFDGVNKYIRITDIDDDTREFTPSPLTTPSGELENQYLLNKGDIVFARTGASVGKSYLYKRKDGRLYFAGFLIKLTINKANPYFVYNQTLTEKYRKWVKIYSMRSGQPGINAEEYKEFEFAIPSLEEQTKIADFLSSVDEKISLLNQQYDLLWQYKKGMMQKIFSQEVRFKDENGKEFPEWNRKFIGNILTIGSGRDYKHLNAGNVPVFGTGGFMTMVDQYLFEGETVCIGRKGTIDKPFYYNGKIWTVDTLFYTHEFKGAHPKFVYQLFLTINWKEYNEASGVPSLSKNTIEKIEVNIPYLSEQNKISNVLSALDDKIAAKKAELDKLKTWKQGLLQQMFI